MEASVEIRRLGRDELTRVGEIDRTERIELLYEQHGTELVERPGEWSAPAWDPNGSGPHSVAAQRRRANSFRTGRSASNFSVKELCSTIVQA